MTSLSALLSPFRGMSTRARALRGTGFTILNVGGRDFLRLLANLVLTRLLFPEAFGLMALTQVFIYGLQTFSDVGIHAMLIQHKRGGERVFLDTLWTMQIIRGVILWAGACALAFPAAYIYDQPLLTVLLPVAALSLFIEGFKTTKEAEANREITIERVVVLRLCTQLAGLIVTALLAYWLRSVWALVAGTLVASVMRVIVMHMVLPGKSNRLHWDWAIVKETLTFGFFIFLSTGASFLINMGNRIILGAYLPIAVFGVLNIAIMLGAAPGQISRAIAQTVIFPLYRIKPAQQSTDNQRNLFRARRMVALMSMGMCAVLAILGVWVVDVLYDPRYALAGPMIVLIALRGILISPFVGAQEALIGNGDSKRHFYLNGSMAALQLSIIFAGITWFGVAGALIAPAVANLLLYPMRARFISRYAAWDIKGDLMLMTLGLVLVLAISWFNWDALLLAFDLNLLQ
ncbi:oligosaccharide flippase family protein [uncultured Roseobacter sp.]|uniref:oligosaccharide flippase family protein n=1 Tax=uncultured Roseobacter sp. TaxID=114847 RepID=UPI0026212826|nr:oligosaccharide flippase family protein [uncultured Roseobacter sp.]